MVDTLNPSLSHENESVRTEDSEESFVSPWAQHAKQHGKMDTFWLAIDPLLCLIVIISSGGTYRMPYLEAFGWMRGFVGSFDQVRDWIAALPFRPETNEDEKMEAMELIKMVKDYFWKTSWVPYTWRNYLLIGLPLLFWMIRWPSENLIWWLVYVLVLPLFNAYYEGMHIAMVVSSELADRKCPSSHQDEDGQKAATEISADPPTWWQLLDGTSAALIWLGLPKLLSIPKAEVPSPWFSCGLYFVKVLKRTYVEIQLEAKQENLSDDSNEVVSTILAKLRGPSFRTIHGNFTVFGVYICVSYLVSDMYDGLWWTIGWNVAYFLALAILVAAEGASDVAYVLIKYRKIKTSREPRT